MDHFDYKKYLKEGRINKDFSQLDEKKEDSKKGNKEEQKRLEGAIRDAKDHKKNLDKDIKADEKKLAKLKKDFKRDVVKENEQVGESALAVGAGVAAVFGGAAALAKIIDKLEAGDLGERGKKVADVLAQLGKGAANRYSEGEDKEVKESSKMKKSELKAKIKETILAELSLAESGFEASEAGSQYHAGLYNEAEEDVDVDVDFEDEVNVDAEGDDIEIEKPAVKAKVQVGLSPEETIVQDSLKAAMDAADALGNDKLADQIGNTITFFTREYVVGRNSD